MSAPSPVDDAIPRQVDFEAAAARIAPYLIETPTVPWPGRELFRGLDPSTEVVIKLELLQRGGSFKPRGALNVALNLDEAERKRGFTCVSAGNHAIAVALAAHLLGTTAKVVMPKTANPFRVATAKSYGAEVLLMDSIAEAFAKVEEIRSTEGKTFIHPFEGKHTFAGAGTLGLELLRQAGSLDAIIVPVGGGGLIAGVAAAVKTMSPATKVYGVEPQGARGMSDSLAAGHALPKVEVKTIADSLGPPMHLPLSFGLVQRFVDGMVTVTDDDMCRCMGLMLRDLKVAAEPAPAAGVAALTGPLRDRLSGQRVGLVCCGANIDEATFTRLLGQAS
ncbi:MAG: threonine/serine dehydratase [Hyphomicrobiaceae bacterium]